MDNFRFRGAGPQHSHADGSVLELLPQNHPLLEVDGPAVDREGAVAIVVDRAALLSLRVDPDPDRLEDEEAVFLDQGRIRHAAFDIGEALGDQRRAHVLGRLGRQLEGVELVDVRARAVADVDHLGGEIDRGDGDHAFAALTQGFVAVIPRPDAAADERRRMLHHHVKAHRHDIGAAVVRGRHQDDRTGLEQPVGFGRGHLLHDHLSSRGRR